METSLIDTSEAVAASKRWPSFMRRTAAWPGANRLMLRALGIGILLCWLSAPILGDLWDLWSNRYGFSHGFLVPLISLYLAWLQWPVLRHTQVSPAIVPGTLWVMTAALLLLASEVAGILTTGSMAFILLLAGLVLLLFGVASLKALALPLAYLVFMTPVLDVVTEPLVWPFQLLTANMSVSMLQMLGIPVLLENHIFIVLPTVTLEVARECSGAGLLIAVLAIGLPLAWLTLHAAWARITLVASAVVIAVVANWVRLTVMGLYAQAGGKDLHGPYHILQGLFVDWVAFGFLFLGAWILSRMEPVGSKTFSQEEQASANDRMSPAPSNRAWWLAGITLAIGVIALYSIDGDASGRINDPATFPPVIGAWTVDHQPDSDVPVVVPDADQSFVRAYRASDGRRVALYVAYTKTQRQGKELVGLRTAPLHENALPTILTIGDQVVSANRTMFEQGRGHIPALFWYQIDGTSYADRSSAKLATIKQAFSRGRTDGALVLVFSNMRTGNREESWKMQEEFAAAAFPLLREYLP